MDIPKSSYVEPMVTNMPTVLDLCCGFGGWAEAFIDVGYNVIGFDIEMLNYPGQLILQDVRTMDGSEYSEVDVIVASPPCEEFSRHDQPWTRKRNPPPPDLSIVEACYRIRDEVKPRLFILENVRGAQKWLGQAILHRRGIYLWGDVPPLSAMSDEVLGKQKQSYGSTEKRERAKVPYALAKQIADWCALTVSDLTRPYEISDLGK